MIVLVAPIKSRWMKQNSQKQFDGEVAKVVNVRDKSFSNYIIAKKKCAKDMCKCKRIYITARNEVQKLISCKKKYVVRIDSMITRKLQELRKALKALGLPNET